MARKSGVVKRQRRVDVVAFVYALVLEFNSGRRRSMSGLGRVYQPLADLMLTLVQAAVRETARCSYRLSGVMSAFVEVLGIDSTIVRVTDEMQQEWPAAWSNHTKAAVKIPAVTNVSTRDLRSVKFFPGSRHDVHLLKAGRWMKGKLLIFDLGFFKTPFLERIDACGGFFLCRLKKQANPELLHSHQEIHRHLGGVWPTDFTPPHGSATARANIATEPCLTASVQ